MASKRKKTSQKNTTDCPVMNVSTGPKVVYMDILNNIFPENIKSETGSYLVQSG